MRQQFVWWDLLFAVGMLALAIVFAVWLHDVLQVPAP